MTHLSDERLTELGHADGQLRDVHLAGCPSCQARLAAWRNLTDATMTVATELTGPVVVPSFDSLLGPMLAAQPTNQPSVPPFNRVRDRLNVAGHPAAAGGAVPRLGIVPWAWQLTRFQLRLLPGSFWPLAMGLLIVAGGVALGVNATFAPTAAGAGITLIAVLAAGWVARRESDPRNEMLAVAPAGPMVVLATRLLALTAMAVAGGVAVSLVLVLFRADLSLIHLVLAWLGPVALALVLTTVLSLAAGTAVGVLTGAALWASATTSSLSPMAARNSVLRELWDTNPLTVALAAVLFGVALLVVSRPARGQAGNADTA